MQKEPLGGFSGVRVRGGLDKGCGDGEKRVDLRDILKVE